MRLPKGVTARIKHLRAAKPTHLQMWKKICLADEGGFFAIDMGAWAALYRSIALIDGFTLLVERRNFLAAVPLLRLQVDSIIRLYAFWLVQTPSDILAPLLKGEPLKKYKAKDGHPLTDRYLHEQASKLYPWLSDVYVATSGFVHLSTPHMFAPMYSLDEKAASIGISIGKNAGRKWRSNEILAPVEAFITATECLLNLCAGWLQTKVKGAQRRRQDAKPKVSDNPLG